MFTLDTMKQLEKIKNHKQFSGGEKKQQLIRCHTEVIFVKGTGHREFATFQTPAARKIEGRKGPALWTKAHFPLGCTLLQAG